VGGEGPLKSFFWVWRQLLPGSNPEVVTLLGDDASCVNAVCAIFVVCSLDELSKHAHGAVQTTLACVLLVGHRFVSLEIPEKHGKAGRMGLARTFLVQA